MIDKNKEEREPWWRLFPKEQGQEPGEEDLAYLVNQLIYLEESEPQKLLIYQGYSRSFNPVWTGLTYKLQLREFISI